MPLVSISFCAVSCDRCAHVNRARMTSCEQSAHDFANARTSCEQSAHYMWTERALLHSYRARTTSCEQSATSCARAHAFMRTERTQLHANRAHTTSCEQSAHNFMRAERAQTLQNALGDLIKQILNMILQWEQEQHHLILIITALPISTSIGECCFSLLDCW